MLIPSFQVLRLNSTPFLPSHLTFKSSLKSYCLCLPSSKRPRLSTPIVARPLAQATICPQMNHPNSSLAHLAASIFLAIMMRNLCSQKCSATNVVFSRHLQRKRTLSNFHSNSSSYKDHWKQLLSVF